MNKTAGSLHFNVSFMFFLQFFGLILEGRQGGRRRNSRGHAYRRLDTLEQAMSANTAAPPSKIIY